MKTSLMNIFIVGIVVAIISYEIIPRPSHCAPTGNNNNVNNKVSSSNRNNQNRPIQFFRGLFRRQTSSSATSATSSDSGRQSASGESDLESGGDEAMSQTELDAQKFMDGLPNVDKDNERPSTFRERVSGTFGVLREGVSNQFKTIRENWSDTMEDLRDQWSNSD